MDKEQPEVLSVEWFESRCPDDLFTLQNRLNAELKKRGIVAGNTRPTQSTDAMRENADELTRLSARVAELEQGIEAALACTPRIELGENREAIVYDCGNPWEILRHALSSTGGDNG